LAVLRRNRSEKLFAHDVAVCFELLAELSEFDDLEPMLDRVCEAIIGLGRFRVAVLGYYTPHTVGYGVAGPLPSDVRARFRTSFESSTAEGRTSRRRELYGYRREGTNVLFLPEGEGPDVAECFVPSDDRGGSWRPGDRIMVLVPGSQEGFVGADDVCAMLSLDDPHSGERPDSETFEWLELIDLFMRSVIVHLEHRLLLQSKEASERSYRDLFQALPGTVATLDGGGDVLLSNAGSESVHGVQGLEPGEHVFDLAWDPDLAAKIKALVARGKQLPATEGTLEVDGRTLQVLVGGAPLEKPDESYADVPHAVLAVEDLTELRGLEKELKDREKTEAAARLAGDVAGEFLELMNSLSGSLATTRSLLQGNDDIFIDQLLDDAQNVVERGSVLTKLLAAFSEDEPDEDGFIAVDLGSTCSSAVDKIRRTTGDRIDIVFDQPLTLPKVRGDPSQLHEAITRMGLEACDQLGNSMAEDPDRLPLDWRPTVKVKLSATEETPEGPGEHVLVTVTQNGIELDEDTLLETSAPLLERTGGGTLRGLGISVTHKVVKAHHGVLRADTPPEGGTRFRLWLPVIG
jgi:signal transduction histidine kinase